jgi:hypothetical protein
MRKLTDWAALDWDKSNTVLALQFGASVHTVAKRRTQYGKPMSSPRWIRPDVAEINRRPERRAQSARTQPAATAAAMTTPNAGRGTANIHAVDWVLVAPNGERHQIRNLYEFVRGNVALFALADVQWKRTGGKRGTGGEWCNATAGILNIKGGRAKSWKGWTLLPAVASK